MRAAVNQKTRIATLQLGAEHDAYAARTPFFLPDPRLFRTGRVARMDTAMLRHSLCAALVFLSIMPIVEMVDQLKLSLGGSRVAPW